jgi:hypothetical protein
MKKQFQSIMAKFSAIRTILPLLILAVEIITFIDEKLKAHAAKNLNSEETPLGV